MAFRKLLTLAELPAGRSRMVRAGGREVALFNVGGTLYAIDNVCPHRMGPLAEGCLEGHIVSCPWHAWRFDVRTGQGVSHRGLCVERFAVELRGDEIWVDVGEGADVDDEYEEDEGGWSR